MGEWGIFMRPVAILLARMILAAAAFFAVSGDVVAQGSKVPVSDKPLMLRYSGANSSYIQRLLNTGNVIRPSRRGRWNPPASLSDRRPNQLFPFPLVRNFNATLRFSDLTLAEPTEVTGRWVPTGLRGAGVTTAVDTTLDSRGNIERVLLGSHAGGLFLKRSGLNSDWEQLIDYPRANAQAVKINPADTNHFLVAHQYRLSRDPGSLFQSCDSGATWVDSGPLSLTLNSGSRVDLIVRDMQLIGGNVVIVGQDTQLSKVLVLRAAVGCRVINRNGVQVREPKFDTVRKVLEVSSNAGQPGYLKVFNQSLLLSVRGQASDVLYRSTNAGSTWARIPGADSGPNHFITAYALTATRIVVAYIGRNEGAADSFLRRSVNSGATFSRVDPTELTNRWLASADEDEDLSAIDVDFQDIVLDPNRPNFIGAFIYMRGYAESEDNGVTFVQDIDELQDVRYYRTAPSPEGPDDMAILPTDVMMRLRTERDTGWNSVLMPSDQGIFMYNQDGNVLRNLTALLRLVESRGVAVTACPRIYSGFWHVGAYFVGRDGLINGFNGSEADGFGINRTPADPCAAPAMNLQFGYMANGRTINRNVSDSIRRGAAGLFSWPFPRWPIFGNSTWYYHYPRSQAVYTIDTTNGSLQQFQAGRNWIAHGVEQTRAPTRWYGLSSGFVLSFFSAAEGLNNIIDLDGDITVWRELLDALGTEIVVNGNTLVLYGDKGALITRNGGDSFRTVFAGKRISAATVDRCGWIYLAVNPGHNVDSGVFISKDGGANFRHLGRGDGKSYFRDLEMREATRVLYAATYGESLLKIQVPVVGACG